jgi:hypothetical protein
MKNYFTRFLRDFLNCCVGTSLERKTSAFLILFLLFSFVSVFAQPWVSSRSQKLLEKNKLNLVELQKDFQSFMQVRDTKTKGLGYKQFKRWEWYWQTRVLPNGDFPEAGKNLKEFEAYKASRQSTSGRKGNMESLIADLQTGTWESIAQTTSSGGYDGTGRVNCVAFHPTDINIFYVGTPGGGIWKTTNGGSSWTPLSDFISQTGVTAIVIHPTNPNTIYIGTGDGYGNLDVKGIGVLKSTDGGATWQNTGLSWTTSQTTVVSSMVMSPTNTSVLVATTNDGIYRTMDAGASWTRVRTGRHQDVKFKPGDGNTAYATVNSTTTTSANILKSSDGGATWTLVTALSGLNRINIAVTPSNPNAVAAIASRSTGSTFGGLYYSSNSGTSFELRSSSPNILGYAANGNDTSGQGWYDLCIAISPTDANNILIGGINTWGSTNGGVNWTLKTHWSGASGVPTVHADKHYLAFSPVNSSMVIQCNDGGIYKSTNSGTAWQDITNGLAITMYYRISTAQTNDNVMMGGTQDNGGRKRTSSGTWSMATGGDGMDVAVDPTNANIMYSSYPGGNVYRSTDQFVNNDVTISNNIAASERSGWLSPYTLDPNNSSVIYLGYKNVFKTTNRGDSWTKISTNISPDDNLSEIAVSKSSPGTLYVTNGKALFKTTNDGGSWTTVTPSGLGGNRITYIAISPTNANTVWVTVGGYSAGVKVFKSINGGSAWTNISGTLPNVPMNCIVYEDGTNDALYIGGDIGVYYRDASMSDWAYFNNGLPNCEIISLDIQYASKKLRAGSWGRGVWQTGLYTPNTTCNAPAGLSSSAITVSSATISWSAVSGASNYTVEYKTTSSSTWISSSSTPSTTTSVNLIGLASGTAYDWRVRTNCASGSSGYSVAQFTTQTSGACDAPAGLNSSAITTSTATVNWGSVSGALNYTVEYKSSSSSAWTVAAAATTGSSANLSGLTASTAYDWRVKTNCTGGSDQDITNLGGTVTAQYTDSPATEDIAKVIDNSSSTKYLTFHNAGWIQFQSTGSHVVTRYSITSANDAAERDPLTWTLQGSTNGTAWTTIDTRTNEDFPTRLLRREFTFSNTIAYSYYRLQMTNNSGTILQLAEWEIFGNSGSTSSDYAVAQFTTTGLIQDITNLGGTATAQYTDSPATEDITKVIDDLSSTKYLTFHNAGWIQFQSTGLYVVTRYSITSANDAPERDPLTWTLQGSTNGTAWTTMDTRTNEDFPTRLLRREFTFSNTTAYSYYRLQMTNNSGTILQLAEWEIFGVSSPSSMKAGSALFAEGTEEVSKKLEAYPSPARNEININTIGLEGKSEIRMWDVHNHKVLQKKINAEGEVLDVRELTSGVYVIEVLNGRNILRLRIIKE